MGKTVKTVIVTVLATLGVLFIIILLIPDDEEDDYYDEPATIQEAVTQQAESAMESNPSAQAATESSGSGNATESTDGLSAGSSNSLSGSADESSNGADGSNSDGQGEDGSAEPAGSSDESSAESSGNTATVNIPESEISDKAIKFKTSTLDDKEVSQDIFSDYDLTLVHVWGTYCQPCLVEIGDYGTLYGELPDNVNIIGIVVDVYDGINTNVSQAHDILDSNGVDFVNLRVSDGMYNVIADVQYIPSSFFVDGEGHMVGSLLEGVKFEETRDKLYEYID